MIERLRVRIPTGPAGEFSSQELTFVCCSYSLSVPTPVLWQWHVKDPGQLVSSSEEEDVERRAG